MKMALKRQYVSDAADCVQAEFSYIYRDGERELYGKRWLGLFCSPKIGRNDLVILFLV
jgi:hypothetical protein